MTPSAVLISIPNWVGDVVMATPALRAIRRKFPKTRIVHLMRPYVAEVLAWTGFADDMIFWPDSANQAAPSSHVGLIRRLRREQFDVAILLTNSFRSALVARLAGIPRRVGYARDGRGWLLTDGLRPVLRKASPHSPAGRGAGRYEPVPALDYYNSLARHMGCTEVNDRLELATSSNDEETVDRRLEPIDPARPLIVLNPGANYGPAKCWPAEYYAEVSDALVDRFDARVVASLTPSERPIAERLAGAAKRPIEIFVDPPLGLGPLKALVRRSSLLITNDTGPRHFAAAFDVPVITIFGSSDPAWTDTRFAKERSVMLHLDCQPCMERTCPLKHHNCMQQLTPARVLEEVKELFGGAARVSDDHLARAAT